MKKFTLLALAIIVSLSTLLAGCGGDDSSTAPSTDASAETSTEASADASADAEASTDASADAEVSTDASTDAEVSEDASADASTDASADASTDTNVSTEAPNTSGTANETYVDIDTAGREEPSEVALEIGTAEELLQFATQVNEGNSFTGKKVVLTADIDLDGIYYIPIGFCDAFGANPQHLLWDEETFATVPYFGGYFDGQGHVIKNLYIDMQAGGTGLFGLVRGGTIKNVGVIADTYVYEIPCSALLAAYIEDTLIEGCFVDGTIDIGSTTCNDIGGITALTHGTCVIKNSYSTAGLISSYTIGSIAAYCWDGSLLIENCYTISAVATQDTGFINTGSVLGSAGPNTTVTIKNCHYVDSGLGPVGAGMEAILGEQNINLSLDAKSHTDTGIKSIASDLGDAFKADTDDINEGYPILAWQK